ncbi:MAG: tRNA 2-thiouridine(34) synthase MnmA, partial [Nevskiales bacterium]
SGGVDSSVSALLLQQQGYRVEGLFMFNWADDELGYCSAAEDFQDAARVCEQLKIPLHQADFSMEYRERVFKNFLEEYAAGRTPNPDVLCNREIKFKSFLRHARRLGADCIATGHYARLAQAPVAAHLLRARDPNKDQTYFLCTVAAEALAQTLFPVGGLLKAEVRALAAEHGLPVHDKKDSTGICFIGERRFREFLAGYLPAQPGPIRTRLPSAEIRELGQHQGLMYYTLGQRRGLGIGGQRDAGENPWYVVGKELANQTLWVSQDPRHPNLRHRILYTDGMHWIGDPPGMPLRCTGRIRHRQMDQPCSVRPGDRGLAVTFDQPQQAITPGQFIALYLDERCLGGGAIAETAA